MTGSAPAGHGVSTATRSRKLVSSDRPERRIRAGLSYFIRRIVLFQYDRWRDSRDSPHHIAARFHWRNALKQISFRRYSLE